MTAEQTLEILIQELRKGAAGPCDYWYRQLADRLQKRLLAPNGNEEKAK